MGSNNGVELTVDGNDGVVLMLGGIIWDRIDGVEMKGRN